MNIKTNAKILMDKLFTMNIDSIKEELRQAYTGLSNEDLITNLIHFNIRNMELQTTIDNIRQGVTRKDTGFKNFNLLIDAIALETGVPVDSIKGNARNQPIVELRFVLAYIARYNPSMMMGFKNIGKVLGGRDHSSIMYSITRYSDLMKYDQLYQDRIDNLMPKVQTHLDFQIDWR